MLGAQTAGTSEAARQTRIQEKLLQVTQDNQKQDYQWKRDTLKAQNTIAEALTQ